MGQTRCLILLIGGAILFAQSFAIGLPAHAQGELPKAPTVMLGNPLPAFATHSPYLPKAAIGASNAKKSSAGLSLPDLIAMSLENHPRLAQARFAVAAAAGKSLQAGLYPNPAIGATWDELGDREGASGINTIPLVTQEIVTAGKIDLERAAAQLQTERRRLDLDRRRLELLANVRRGYFSVLAWQMRIYVLEELTEKMKKALISAEALRRAKSISQFDLLLMRVNANRMQTRLESARQQRLGAWRKLAATIGSPHLPPVAVQGSLTETLPQHEYDATKSNVLKSHPTLLAAHLGATRAHLIWKRALVERIPNVTVGAGYVRQNQNRSDDWTIQFSLPLPIFNRNQGNILAAQANVGAAAQQIRSAENNLLRRLGQAFGKFTAARKNVQVYRNKIVPDADNAYKLAPIAFQNGRLNYSQMILVQQDAIKARLEFIDILAQAWQAECDIRELAHGR